MEIAPSSNPFSEKNIPSSAELFTAFDLFMGKWAKLSAQQNLLDQDDTASSLSLEQGMLFQEPFSGILILRTVPDFEDRLVPLITGEKREDPGLFMEMNVLFWHFLVKKTWNLDTRTLTAARLKRTVPVDWPDRRPKASFSAKIQNLPLEARLWMDVMVEETRPWKK